MLAVGERVEVLGKGQGNVLKIESKRARVQLDSGNTVWRDIKEGELRRLNGEAVTVPPTPRAAPGEPPNSARNRTVQAVQRTVSLKEGLMKQGVLAGVKLKHVARVNDKSGPVIDKATHIGHNHRSDMFQEVTKPHELKHVSAIHDASKPMIEKGTHIASNPKQFVVNEIKQGLAFSMFVFRDGENRKPTNIESSPVKSWGKADAHEPLKYESCSLDDFDLKKTIGMGTFGRVMLAQDKKTQRHVAVKVLKKPDVVALREVDHVKNEKKVLHRVESPFIVNLLGSFQDPHNLYMVMEYVPGGELYTLHRSRGKFDSPTAAFYIAQIAEALDHLHSRNLVYRDLKPENVLVGRDGYLKLADFGSAKLIEDNTMTMCGTPEYQAPEIIQRRGHNKPVDCWSLGVLVFELLTGATPFVADTPFQVYKKIYACDVRFPDDFPADARDLVSKLLDPEPSDRLTMPDIKAHKWLAQVNWDDLRAKRLQAPIVPELQGEGDASNFGKFSEVDLRAGAIVDRDGKIFGDF